MFEIRPNNIQPKNRLIISIGGDSSTAELK